MPGIFISYRREDSSGYAGRLFDILSARFGQANTFMDFDAIHGGDDFSAVIEAKIAACEVLLAVIGPHWLTTMDPSGMRRVDKPHDFVRLEVGNALKRGIRVIPVLVGGAGIPRAEDLPQDVRPLVDREAIEVRDTHFHADAEQLVNTIRPSIRHSEFWQGKSKGVRLTAAVLAALALLSAAALLLIRQVNSHSLARSASRVAGRWLATVKYDWGDTYPEIFDFEVHGNELSGTASLLQAPRGIMDGIISDDRLSFTTHSLTSISSDEKTHVDKHYYKGLVQKDAIEFTMMTDSEVESHVPIHFTAHKAKSK